MESLTILYDPGCSLCEWATRWLQSRRQLIPLYFLPAGSDAAKVAIPWIDPAVTLEDITVIADDGAVYQGERAWIMCLWCLGGYRKLAERLSNPALMPSVRQVVATVSRYRPHSDDNCTERSCGY